jgi:hypothetical protein
MSRSPAAKEVLLDFVDCHQQVSDAEAGHQASKKRIVNECRDDGTQMQQRVVDPETRPGRHDEKYARLEAVHHEEQSHRHQEGLF